jgi:hypothetical protein
LRILGVVAIRQQNPKTTSAGGGTPPKGKWRGSEAFTSFSKVTRQELWAPVHLRAKAGLI